MFEKASRLKLRFDTTIGALSAEQLWDLPLTHTTKANLDNLARALHRQLKNDDNVSFVVTERKSDEVTQLSFDIVKHIIDIKLAERDAALKAAESKVKRQQILQLIADKENTALASLPLEDLKRMIGEMS